MRFCHDYFLQSFGRHILECLLLLTTQNNAQSFLQNLMSLNKRGLKYVLNKERLLMAIKPALAQIKYYKKHFFVLTL